MQLPDGLSEFTRRQQSYWREVDERHFRWVTEGPYIAGTEAALLAPAGAEPGERVLEIGCGEGGNLVHLRRRQAGLDLFAVDFSQAKARFAHAATAAHVASADAARLPFRGGAFDAVLVRDLLHHVPDRKAVVSEALRVLRPGGSITVIEPNGRNPLVAAMAVAIPPERGMLQSTMERVATELRDAGATRISTTREQPLPISRVLLHYRLGLPELGRSRTVAALLRIAERSAAILPRAAWAYFVVRGFAPGRA
ncbi:MAG: class I SAM-dependent methyltransferase [Myxococcales bacterium]